MHVHSAYICCELFRTCTWGKHFGIACDLARKISLTEYSLKGILVVDFTTHHLAWVD